MIHRGEKTQTYGDGQIDKEEKIHNANRSTGREKLSENVGRTKRKKKLEKWLKRKGRNWYRLKKEDNEMVRDWKKKIEDKERKDVKRKKKRLKKRRLKGERLKKQRLKKEG